MWSQESVLFQVKSGTNSSLASKLNEATHLGNGLKQQRQQSSSCISVRFWSHYQGPQKQTKPHYCQPHTEGLVWFQVVSLSVSLESVSSHELKTAVSLGFPSWS